jgi:hypothetical protein
MSIMPTKNTKNIYIGLSVNYIMKKTQMNLLV